MKPRKETRFRSDSISKSHIVLRSALGLQHRVTHIGIVQVIEGGPAIYLFIKSAKHPIIFFKRLIRKKYRRSHFTFIRRFYLSRCFLIDQSRQNTGLHFQTVGKRKSRCRRNPVRVPVGRHVLRQTVPLHVVCHRDIPISEYRILIGYRDINLSLFILVVDPHQLIVVIHIMGIIESILGIHLNPIFAGNILLIDTLHERIPVPQTLSVAPHVIDDSPRNPPLGTIMINIGFPITVGQVTLQSSFEPNGIDVSVFTGSRGIVCRLSRRSHPPVTEFIFPARIDPLAIECHADRLAKFIFKQNRRIQQIE